MSVAFVSPPFPVLWPAEYRRAALRLGEGNPLLLMGEPHPSELAADPEALPDPVGESRFQPVPFAVRKHRDRALLLATSRCFFYCRFCFRRGVPPGDDREPGAEDWKRILAWLRRTPQVEEAILSGGDPLTLSDDALRGLATSLAHSPHLKRWRIHTRAPITHPGRIGPALVRALAGALPLTIVVHANHPAELRPSAAGAIRILRDAGHRVAVQSVLLRGVNDTPEVLVELFDRLTGLGVLPHYLHHPDRAPGNARFRLSLARGLRLYREFKERCASTVPPYVVDLPNGAGKCPVASLSAVAEERGGLGRRTRYRWLRPPDWDALGREKEYEWWDLWDTPGVSAGQPSSWPRP